MQAQLRSLDTARADAPVASQHQAARFEYDRSVIAQVMSGLKCWARGVASHKWVPLQSTASHWLAPLLSSVVLLMIMPAGAFAQSQPIITSFTPSTGPIGTAITVTGSGFTGATYANVGWAGDAGLTVVSDTQATITVPADAPIGSDPLTIGNASYAGYSATNFTVTSTVPQPVISSFTPTTGPIGTVITVTGSGFTGATYANVGWAGDAGLTVVSDTQATVTVPADAPIGADPLTIGNPTYAGYSATNFTVTSTVPQPVIASFTPSTGPVGTVITVIGSGFTGATYANVGWA